MFRLNEGFATLYENFLASLVYPEDRLMDTFVVDVVQSVLDVDASPSIRPMTYYVENPDRITALFDRVAYDKCKLITNADCRYQIEAFNMKINSR